MTRTGNRRGRSGVAIAAALACALAAPFAKADTPPSTWDLARDPAERDRWVLHVHVERLIHAPPPDDSVPLEGRRGQELRLEAALAMLEEAGAAHSPDIRLRFDLGIVYWRIGDAQGRADMYRRVIDVIGPALEEAPDHPAAIEALEALVYAYAKLDRPREELAAWRRYIPRLVDDRQRAGAMMNMGEAEMRVGEIDGALATFGEVLRLCGELPNTAGISSTYVLTLWDQAVALDRSGDARGALDTAAKASHMNVGLATGGAFITRDPDVFFVPDWERQWYLALGAAAAGRDAHDARDGARFWAESERHWTAYVESSSAAGGRDPWLPIARVRQGHAHAQRLAAERRAASLPAKGLPSVRSWDES